MAAAVRTVRYPQVADELMDWIGAERMFFILVGTVEAGFKVRAFYYDRPSRAKYPFVLDPEFTELSLRNLERALKTCPELIWGVFAGDEDLESHGTLQLGVESLVHDAHSPPADLLENLVWAQVFRAWFA